MKPVYVFTALCISYLAFSASVYLMPAAKHPPPASGLPLPVAGGRKPEARGGKLTWQKYNCQSCHQIYGLGGYLGPDLTNVVRLPGRNDAYLAGVIRAGNRRMPPFKGSDDELQSILTFLHTLNATGDADPRHAEVTWWGDARPNLHAP
jgi:nitric oxide reductase subunit C